MSFTEENPQFTNIWSEAFDHYQKNTGRDIKANSTLKTLRSTDDLLDKIKDESKDFDKFRNKHAKLWDVLSSAMRPIELLGSLTQGALTLTPFAPASTVLGAVLFMVQSARNVSGAYDSITILLARVQQFTGRLEEYTEGTIDLKLRRIVVEILVTLLGIFARSEKLIKRSRFLQYMSVTFLGDDGKVQASMDCLDELTKNEQGMVQALTFSGVKRIEKNVEGVVSTLSDSAKKEKEEKREEESRKVLKEKLNSEGVEEKVRDLNDGINEKRLEGTGDWVLEESLFKDWYNKKASLLWILGNPGAGKSFISSRIIKYLTQRHPQAVQYPEVVSIGFFYIKENDQQLRKISTILQCIASQIAKNDPVFRNNAVNVCTSSDNVRNAKIIWMKLFLEFFSSTQHDNSLFIVIDGVDEAPKEERELLLELLGDLVDAPVRPRIQILLVGRRDLQYDIQAAWEEHTIRIRKDFIEVSAEKNNKDILDYITEGVKKVRILHKPNKELLRQQIIDELTHRANGMFLWVNLMIEDIKGKSRESEITAALHNAPRDLNKMIKHVFERLAADPDNNRDDLNEMLAWVACAEKPLLLGELDVILRLKPPIGEEYSTLEDDLRGKYASFFALHRADGKTTETLLREHEEKRSIEETDRNGTADSDATLEEDQAFQSDPTSTTLQFSHASIREYLVQEGLKTLNSEIGIGLDKNNAQRHISATCLAIICDNRHGEKYKSPHLLDYAAGHVLKHLGQVEIFRVCRDDKKDIVQNLRSLLHDESVMERWLGLLEYAEHIELIEKGLIEDQYFKSIQIWFVDKDALVQFNSEVRLWIDQATTSVQQLFRPMALCIARCWLKGGKACPEPDDAVLFLHHYSLLNEGSREENPGTTKKSEIVSYNNLSAQRIRELAQFAGIEKNSVWHESVAKALQIADHLDETRKELLISIDIDPTNWTAMRLLGNVFSSKGDYSKAIEWKHKALEHMPDEDDVLKSIRIDIWIHIAFHELALKHFGDAIKASEKACLLAPHDLNVLETQIYCLSAAGRNREVIDLFRGLDKETSPPGQQTLTIELLFNSTVHQPVAQAAKAVRELDFVIKAMRLAIDAAERIGRPNTAVCQRYQLADVLFAITRDEEGATQLWEEVRGANLTESSNDTQYYWLAGWYSVKASDSLSEFYYARAVAAEKKGEDPKSWVSKLEALSKQKSGANSDEDEDSYSTRDASLMLGLWYRQHGLLERAKACFKAKILECIAILTDDDPTNDFDGYNDLAQTLLKAGDKRAAAAFTILMKTLDDCKSRKKAKKQADVETDHCDVEARSQVEIAEAFIENETVDSTAAAPALDEATEDKPLMQSNAGAAVIDDVIEITSDENFRMFDCDGPCEREWYNWTALHFCEICLDSMCFCDVCYELLKTDKLPDRKCNPEHTFYQAYPIDKSMEGIAAISIDGEMKPRMAWLDEVKQAWAT